MFQRKTGIQRKERVDRERQEGEDEGDVTDKLFLQNYVRKINHSSRIKNCQFRGFRRR